jgi:RNA polymerase sigma factor (sigma-70 family)
MQLADFQDKIVPLRHKLYRLALRITGSGLDAEDVVQEVFEKIWVKRDTPTAAAVQNWESWSVMLTRNLSIDKTRHQKHRAVAQMPDHFDATDSALTPEESLQSADSVQFIGRLVAALPEKQSSVLHLRDVEEMSYDEISAAMQITIDDVKVTLHRARKTLREQLLLSYHPKSN